MNYQQIGYLTTGLFLLGAGMAGGMDQEKPPAALHAAQEENRTDSLEQALLATLGEEDYTYHLQEVSVIKQEGGRLHAEAAVIKQYPLQDGKQVFPSVLMDVAYEVQKAPSGYIVSAWTLLSEDALVE